MLKSPRRYWDYFGGKVTLSGNLMELGSGNFTFK
jgi:hypothetical protein